MTTAAPDLLDLADRPLAELARQRLEALGSGTPTTLDAVLQRLYDPERERDTICAFGSSI